MRAVVGGRCRRFELVRIVAGAGPNEIVDVYNGAQAVGDIFIPRDTSELFGGESAHTPSYRGPVHLADLHKISRGELAGHREHSNRQERSAAATQSRGRSPIHNDGALDLCRMLQPELSC